MLKVLGLTATTVLLLGSLSCTQTSQNSDNSPKVAAATPTPASPSPSPTPSASTTANVKPVNFKWTDEASGTPITTIKVGGTVTWTAAPGPPHSLERVAPSADNGCDELDSSFDAALTLGQPITVKFDKVGTFGYHCGIHKGNPDCKTPPGDTTPRNMPGVIKVVP